jgi:hypothetical protein
LGKLGPVLLGDATPGDGGIPGGLGLDSFTARLFLSKLAPPREHGEANLVRLERLGTPKERVAANPERFIFQRVAARSKEGCPTSMRFFPKQSESPKRSVVFWSCSFLLLLNGCGAKPECDSFETRDAVLKAVLNDHKNALGKYAAENSTAVKSGDTGPEREKAKQQPSYLLGDKMVTVSTSRDKRTLTCSGSISATVGDAKASKEIDFTVQQSPEGKISVSVKPFQF